MRENIADMDFQGHTIRTILHSKSDLIKKGNFNLCLKIGNNYLEHWENQNNKDKTIFIFKIGSISPTLLRKDFDTCFTMNERYNKYSPIFGMNSFDFLYDKNRKAIVFHSSLLHIFYRFTFVRMGNLKYICNDGFKVRYETSYSYYHKHFFQTN